MARFPGLYGLAASLVAVAACTSGPAFPDVIAFGSERLTKATSWTRDGKSGVVYVPPGQALPEASLQVGLIVSTDHTTGKDLYLWVMLQSAQAGDVQAHSSGGVGESCQIATAFISGGTRLYVALRVCETGVARAACVEADQAIDQEVFNRCLHSRGCQSVCDAQWLARREALDELVANALATR